MSRRTSDLLARWRRLTGARSQWHIHWDDLARVQLTRRLGFVTDVQEGERRADDLYDGTGLRSARGLANNVAGMVRPEGQPWFFMKAAEDADGKTDEAKDWLSDAEDRMRKAFDNPRARFRQATGEADLDLVVLGTATVFVGEIIGRNQLFFQSVWLKDAVVFFAEDGSVGGVFRSRRIPVWQAVERFGVEQLSEGTRKLAEDDSKKDDKIEFLFAVVKRDDGRPDAFLAKDLPIADIVIEVEAAHEVTEGGFHEMPYVVPRWDTSSGEDYGRSPGMIALPDTNTSQAIGETMLVAGQRAADPALLAPSDAFINAPHTYPGGIAYYEADAVKDLGTNPIRPLETGKNFPLSRDMQQDTREQIRMGFLLDLFNLPRAGDAKMTATEIIARQQEFIRELGPVFGRLETDYSAPMVERAFNIMLRANAFLPVPEVLSQKSVRFEYESPVKRIREQSEALAADAWVERQAEIAGATGRPEVLDVINFDNYARFTAEATNIPNILLRDKDEVEAARKARAEAQAQAAQAEQAQQIAETVSTAANIPGVKGALEGATGT